MTAATLTISESVKGHIHEGRMTAGYYVSHDGVPVFVGTFSECAQHGSDVVDAGVPGSRPWSIRDARGLVVA